MKIKPITTSLIALLIVGCGIAPVKPLTDKQMQSYSDIEKLFEDKFPEPFSSQYSTLVYSDLQRPFVYAKNYCEYEGGQIIKTDNEKALALNPGNGGYSNSYKMARENINFVFGTFDCTKSGKAEWAVNISHNSHKVEAGAFYSTVVDTTVYDSSDLRNQQVERMLAKQQAKLDEQERLEREKKAHEARLKAEKERREKEMQRIQVALQSINNFRDNINVSTVTNCGPVLEIRESLIKVYFPVKNYGNEHWINKNLVFPSNYSCNFYNGQYQPPVV